MYRKAAKWALKGLGGFLGYKAYEAADEPADRALTAVAQAVGLEWEHAGIPLVEAPLGVATRGSLDFGPDGGNMPLHYARVNARDFVASVKFINPFSSSLNPWSHILDFRATGLNEFVRVRFGSDRKWVLELWRNGSDNKGVITTIAEGETGHINLAGHRSNRVKLVAVAEFGALFINDRIVGTFDLSAQGVSGDIVLMSGAIPKYRLPNKATAFKDFRVSSLTGNPGPQPDPLHPIPTVVAPGKTWITPSSTAWVCQGEALEVGTEMGTQRMMAKVQTKKGEATRISAPFGAYCAPAPESASHPTDAGPGKTPAAHRRRVAKPKQ
jgi:hypothetical protein